MSDFTDEYTLCTWTFKAKFFKYLHVSLAFFFFWGGGSGGEENYAFFLSVFELIVVKLHM